MHSTYPSSSHACCSLVINRTKSSLALNVSASNQDQVVSLPPSVLGRTVELRVYVDKSVLEVLVGDFLLLSSRVYPVSGDGADRVGSFITSRCADLMMGNISSWKMKNVYQYS